MNAEETSNRLSHVAELEIFFFSFLSFVAILHTSFVDVYCKALISNKELYAMLLCLESPPSTLTVIGLALTGLLVHTHIAHAAAGNEI